MDSSYTCGMQHQIGRPLQFIHTGRFMQSSALDQNKLLPAEPLYRASTSKLAGRGLRPACSSLRHQLFLEHFLPQLSRRLHGISGRL